MSRRPLSAGPGALLLNVRTSNPLTRLSIAALWMPAGLAWVLAFAGAGAWLVVLGVVVGASSFTVLLAVQLREAREQRRRALEAWRRGRARTRQAQFAQFSAARGAIEALDAPLLGTDAAGMIDLANSAARRWLGVGNPVGARLEDLLPHAEVLDLHQRAAGGTPERARVRVGRDGVPRVFDVAASPGPGGRVFVLLRDVTDLAQALQLKTDFVANASHELRTPLASIRGAVETLGALDDQPELRARMTRMIEENAARLEDLVNDLLDLSRLESPEAAVRLAPVDLIETISEVEVMFRPALSAKRLNLRVEIPDPLRRVETDRHLITLALRNLIDNAIKFTRDGTTIRVSAIEMPGPRPGVRLEVADQGVGIPMEQQSRIFERFYQLDGARTGSSVHRGTGLGLAIVKHAVRLLRGGVGVRSAWQQGATVWFELPDCVLTGHASPAERESGTA